SEKMKKNLRLILFSSLLTAMVITMLNPVSAQLLPDGDVSVGLWTPTPLWSNINELDGDFISVASDKNTTGVVHIQNPVEEGIYNLITVNIRAKKSNVGGANRFLNTEISINGQLQGAIVTANLTGSYFTYSFTWNVLFSHTELNDLRVIFSATGRTNGNPDDLRTVEIDYLEVIMPDPIPLPVKLKSFTATRKQAIVELNWVTAMEQNNGGFEVQRQSGSG